MFPVPSALRIPLVLTALLWPALAAAQSSAPAHIARVDGGVVLERAGVAYEVTPGTLFVEGDRLSTTGGRAEILWDAGGALRIDTHTTVDLLSVDLLRLTQGRLAVDVASGGVTGPPWRIDTPAATVELQDTGQYLVAVFQGPGAAEVEVSVIAGTAALVSDSGVTTVSAGQRASAFEGRPPSAPAWFNAAASDPLLAWIDTGPYAAPVGYDSQQYLPGQLVTYAGVFAQYGAWQPHSTYGQVWYPKVRHGWRPYHHGRWRHVGRYGWVWVGNDPWAWPTHHYGRWGFTANVGWYWIPAARWGPAWVHWAVAPGYVGWTPLGWNGRPTVAFFSRHHRGFSRDDTRFGSRRWRAGRFSGSSRRDRFAGHGPDPWDAWTLVPRDRFDDHDVISAALDRERAVRASSAVAFATQPTAPLAVPRGSVSQSRGAVIGRAVPRPAGTPASRAALIERNRGSAPAFTGRQPDARAMRRSPAGRPTAVEEIGNVRDAIGRARTRIPAFSERPSRAGGPVVRRVSPPTARGGDRDVVSRARTLSPAFSPSRSARPSSSVLGVPVPRGPSPPASATGGRRSDGERPATGMTTPRFRESSERFRPSGDRGVSRVPRRAVSETRGDRPSPRAVSPSFGSGRAPSTVTRSPQSGSRPTGMARPRAGGSSAGRSDAGGRGGAAPRRHP